MCLHNVTFFINRLREEIHFYGRSSAPGFDTAGYPIRRPLRRYLGPQIPRVLWMTAFLFAGIALKLINPQVLRIFLDTAQAGQVGQSLTAAAGLFILFAIGQQAMSLATHYTAKTVGWNATNQVHTAWCATCCAWTCTFTRPTRPAS